MLIIYNNNAMENKKKYKVTIIGFGPTGMYACYYCGIKQIDCLILEINNTFGGAPARLFPDKPLYDIPGHVKITGAKLVENLYKQALTNKNSTIKYNVEITEILPLNDAFAKYKIIDNKNNEYYTDNIIFSTGYGAFEFVNIDAKIHDEAKSKIFYFVKESNFFKNKKVVICGGGDSAIDYANKLKAIAKVSLIHRRNEFRAHQANVEKAIKSNRINTYKNYNILEIKNDVIKIINNETNQEFSIEYDYILVLYGTNPKQNNIKLKDLYNKVYKINVDQNNEAINYKSIYACGLSTNNKQEQTIITGINDAIRVISKISKE